MNTYAVFAGNTYYPLQGWEDFKQAFYSFDEAEKYASQLQYDWIQIVDLRDLHIVAEYYNK